MAGERASGQRLVATGVQLGVQSIAAQHVEVQFVQGGGEDAQQLFVFARTEPKAQPQRAIGVGGGDLVQFNRAELIGVAGRADVGQLQAALFVEQYCPATALRGVGREQAEQGQ